MKTVKQVKGFVIKEITESDLKKQSGDRYELGDHLVFLPHEMYKTLGNEDWQASNLEEAEEWVACY